MSCLTNYFFSRNNVIKITLLLCIVGILDARTLANDEER